MLKTWQEFLNESVSNKVSGNVKLGKQSVKYEFKLDTIDDWHKDWGEEISVNNVCPVIEIRLKLGSKTAYAVGEVQFDDYTRTYCMDNDGNALYGELLQSVHKTFKDDELYTDKQKVDKSDLYFQIEDMLEAVNKQLGKYAMKVAKDYIKKNK